MNPSRKPAGADYAAIFILSGAGMAYEILLLRVFAYSQWHHFASMAVSLALLGFGTAGTILTFMSRRKSALKEGFFFTGILVAASGMLIAFILPMFVLLRPLFAIWDGAELFKLLVLDFACFIPFLGIALCIGQVFLRWPESTRQLYAVNLIGSGMGTIAASILLSFLFLQIALILLPLITLATATAYAYRFGFNKTAMGIPAAGVLALAIWMFLPPELPLSDFKRLSYLLDLPDATIVAKKPALQAEITVVRSDSIRIAPGLSLQWPHPVPVTDVLVVGSDLALPLPRKTEPAQQPEYLQATLGILPFHLRPDGRGLFFGASEWFPAWHSPLSSNVWILNNAAVAETFIERALPEGLVVRTGSPRQYLSARGHVPSVVYFSSAHANGSATGEDYLLTNESIQRSLKLMSKSGILAIPMQIEYPPRHAPKMMAMILRSLQDMDVEQPSDHVAIVRSMRDALFLVSPSPLNHEDVQEIHAFATDWDFDLVHLAGMPPDKANRWHQLPTPVFYDTARFFFNGSGDLPEATNWYDMNPATDSKPYFWRSTQLSKVTEFLRIYDRQGLIWLDWDLLLSVVKLLFAAIVAAILILIPLGFLPHPDGHLSLPTIGLYFSALGLGFLALEMVVFQQVLLFLPNPIISGTCVFTVFLLGAGLGSLTAPKANARSPHLAIFLPIAFAAILAAIVLFLGKNFLLVLPAWMSLILIVFALGPLSWCLGRAFPWGLRQLDASPTLIPWAWGINGFASVVAAPAAVLLSVQYGHPTVWILALFCYLIAGIVARSWAK